MVISFLFFQSCLSLKPLLFFSGFNGSPLYGTFKAADVDNAHKDWCPSDKYDINHYQFYPSNDKEFYTAYPKCQALLMRAYYDEKDKKVTTFPGITVVSSEFGNYSQLLNFEDIIAKAINIGYVPQKNLFGVGYNFMLHPLASIDTFDEIKKNVEIIKQKEGEKVVLLSHSQGTHFVSQFLSNFSKPEWVKEYVDSAIFVAPAFAGSGTYRRLIEAEYGQFITTDEMKQSILRMPGQHILLPNYVAYGNKTVIYNYPEYGKEATARDVPNFLKSIGRMDDDAYKIFQQVEKFLSQPIPEPPVKSYIMYNTGINTGCGYRIERLTKEIKVVMGAGDGTYTPEGAELACNTWSNVVCHNWNMNKANYDHANMLHVPESVQMIFDFIGNDMANTPEATVNKSRGMNAIMFGTPIILGAQLVIVIVSIIFIAKKQSADGHKSAGSAEQSAFKEASEL